MKYEKEFEFYSTDAGANGEVRPSVILRYLQEAAVNQMKDEGPSYRDLWAQGKAFILSRINLQIYAPLYEFQRVTVQTWACSERGASFGRSYRMLRNGDVVAEAVAVWALLDVNAGTLLRVEDQPFRYGADEPLSLSPRFTMPKVPLFEAGKRQVQYEDVDCNRHLNNARYPDWLCDLIPEIHEKRVTGIQIHYVAEAPLYETLTQYWGEADDGRSYVFEFLRADGNVNCRARVEVAP